MAKKAPARKAARARARRRRGRRAGKRAGAAGAARKKVAARKKKAAAPEDRKRQARAANGPQGQPRQRKLTRAARKAAPAKRRESAARRRPDRSAEADGSGRARAAARRRADTGPDARNRPHVSGRTNPMPTRALDRHRRRRGRHPTRPGLERARRQLREIEETVPSPPSSLDLDRTASAARSGRASSQRGTAGAHRNQPGHDRPATSTPTGKMPTRWATRRRAATTRRPDQDRVDDIGKALGVEYEDNEELKASDKIAERDKHRWELDPASSEDYPDRD